MPERFFRKACHFFSEVFLKFVPQTHIYINIYTKSITNMKKKLLFLFYLLVSILHVQGQAKYIFLFIGDGMGVNQVNATEMYQQSITNKRTGIQPLTFTQLPISSVSTTCSASNWVTDSSAAGTALACGTKTNNGTIGLDSHQQPISSIAEKAKKKGKKVGIVTSVSIDHATPAAFYAHQPSRDMYYEIGLDLAKSEFDFYGGSGFLKPSTSFTGENKRDLFSIFKEAGYTLTYGMADFLQKNSHANRIILMAPQKGHSLPYAIDRTPEDLTLTQITQCAIRFLDNPEGFFLMVEGGKIDWSCHGNDGATMIQEIQDFDQAVQTALDFYRNHPEETLIVVTADHETGGITLGNDHYNLNVSVLANQKISIDQLSRKISQLRKLKSNNVNWEDIKNLLTREMGFWEKTPITWEQEKKLRDEFEHSFVQNKLKYEHNLYSDQEPIAACAKEILNEKAMINWAHGGHTAGYVPVYAIGIGAEKFQRKLDNTDIPSIIAQIGKYDPN